jgi:hypothetical protein
LDCGLHYRECIAVVVVILSFLISNPFCLFVCVVCIFKCEMYNVYALTTACFVATDELKIQWKCDKMGRTICSLDWNSKVVTLDLCKVQARSTVVVQAG